jgi:poly(hydroxyalkanoate) granule-associated protein
MARKTTSRSRFSSAANDSEMGKAVADSAQKIWLAGLGAFERAKSEGPKMFDMLVEQGKSLGGRAREVAGEAMQSVREGASSAGGRFDKLEQVFEDRVSKSLRRLGVLTRGEVSDLSKQVRGLAEDVRSLMKQSGKRTGGAKAKRGGAGKRPRAASAAKGKAKRAGSAAKRGTTRGSRARRA